MAGPDNRETRERRRLRPKKGKEGVDAWLDDVLFGGGEVTFLVLPTMTWFVMFTPYTRAKSASAFTFFTMVVVVGTLRGGWVDVGAPWPQFTVRRGLFRVPLYGGVFLAGGIAGALVETHVAGGVPTALTAMVVPVALLVGYVHYAAWRGA